MAPLLYKPAKLKSSFIISGPSSFTLRASKEAQWDHKLWEDLDCAFLIHLSFSLQPLIHEKENARYRADVSKMVTVPNLKSE